MTTTPYLGVTEVAPNQSQKEATINTALRAIEAAENATLAVSMAGGNVTLSVNQFTRNFIFRATGATAARTINLPAQVNGTNTCRVFVARNASGYDLTVQVTGAPGTSVVVPNGESRICDVDGSGNVAFCATPPGLGTFLALTDVPHTYTGQAKRVVRVKASEDGIEFVVLALSDLAGLDLTTAPPTAGQALVWDSATSKFKPGSVMATGNTGSYRGTYGVAIANQTWDFEDGIVPGAFTFKAGVGGVIVSDTDGAQTKALTFNAGGSPPDYAHGPNADSWFTFAVIADSTHNTVTIRNKTQGEASYDGLQIDVDGVATAYNRPGVATTYTDTTVTLTAGAHTIKVRYTSDNANQYGWENTKIGQIIAPLAGGGANYKYGDVVDFNGKRYMCIVAGTVNDPSVATDWAALPTSIALLADVDLTTAQTDGQALVWNASAGKWKAGTVASGGGGSSSSTTQVSARYWRLKLMSLRGDNSQTAASGFAELVFKDASGTTLTTGGTAFASSINSSGSNADKAFDGNTGTAWYTANGRNMGEWIGYDFGSAKTVASFAITPDPGFVTGLPRDLMLEYSSDGSEWFQHSQFYLAAPASGVTQTFSVPALKTVTTPTTTTPTIRSSNIASINAASTVVSWPTGTVAGDVVFIFTEHGYGSICPSGWTQVEVSYNGNTQGGTFAKLMTSADITAGNVTVTFGGSFNGVVAAVTITGLGKIADKFMFNSSSSTSYASYLVSGLYNALATDRVIAFFSSRGALNATCPNFTTLQTVNAANGSAMLGYYDTSKLSVLGFTETAAFSAANTGIYISILALRGT